MAWGDFLSLAFEVEDAESKIRVVGMDGPMIIDNSDDGIYNPQSVLLADGDVAGMPIIQVVGEAGGVGEQGPEGPQGLKGDAGEQGQQGIQGKNGDKGDADEAGEE